MAEASGHAALDSAALRAAEGMRFVPAELGGAPHPVWVNLPVAFVPPDIDAVEGATPEQVRAWADSAGALAPSAVEEPAQATNPDEAIRITRRAGRELVSGGSPTSGSWWTGTVSPAAGA